MFLPQQDHGDSCTRSVTADVCCSDGIYCQRQIHTVQGEAAGTLLLASDVTTPGPSTITLQAGHALHLQLGGQAGGSQLGGR